MREEEFAPVKNANGAKFDTPESARLLVLRLHARWVVAAGGFLTHTVPLYATGNLALVWNSGFLKNMWSKKGEKNAFCIKWSRNQGFLFTYNAWLSNRVKAITSCK